MVQRALRAGGLPVLSLPGLERGLGPLARSEDGDLRRSARSRTRWAQSCTASTIPTRPSWSTTIQSARRREQRGLGGSACMISGCYLPLGGRLEQRRLLHD